MVIHEETFQNVKSYVDATLDLLDAEEKYELDDRSKQSCRLLQPLKFLAYVKVIYSKVNVDFEMPKERRIFDRSVGTKTLQNSSVILSQYCPEGYDESVKDTWYGIVVNVSDEKLTVQFTDGFQITNTDLPFCLSLNIDDKSLKRSREILIAMLVRPNYMAELLELRFGSRPQVTSEINNLPIVEFCNNNLTVTQQHAVQFSMNKDILALIHGPPGTGKTTTLVEIILQVVKTGGRVLVCTPTNIAVDNVVTKLSAHKVKMVRIGHLARISNTALYKYTLDSILSEMPESAQILETKSELLDAVISLQHCHVNRRGNVVQAIKGLRRELVERESKVIHDALKSCNVVCSTIMSSSLDGVLRHIAGISFELVVIDESTQSTEPQSYIPMQWGKKVVLAGDHCQLAPLVRCPQAINGHLDVSFFQQVIKRYGEAKAVMLTDQFRMNVKIMNWVSNNFYDGRLVAHESVANQLLRDLPDVEESVFTSVPLVFIDTSGCKFTENLTDTNSYENHGEAQLVLHAVESLRRTGIKPNEIGVITPYRAQLSLLSELATESALAQDVEIHTVDGFQGREKEAIVFCFVRSNSHQATGFVSDRRRVNVAVSRAKRLLCLVGDGTTLRSDPLISDLINYVKEEGVVLSGFEFINEINIVQTPVKASQSTSRKRHKKNKKSSSEGTLSDAMPEDKEFVGSFYADCDSNEDNKRTESLEITQHFSNLSVGDSSDSSDVEVLSMRNMSQKGIKNKPGTSKGSSIKSNTSKKMLEKSNCDTIDDDFLKEIAQINKICATVNCKERVTTVYFDCNLCRKRYCIPHALPEVHGCGSDAKKEARKSFLHPPPPPVDQRKRKELQKKLGSRLEKLKESRKGTGPRGGKKS